MRWRVFLEHASGWAIEINCHHEIPGPLPLGIPQARIGSQDQKSLDCSAVSKVHRGMQRRISVGIALIDQLRIASLNVFEQRPDSHSAACGRQYARHSFGRS
jgi:hypothetical protein